MEISKQNKIMMYNTKMTNKLFHNDWGSAVRDVNLSREKIRRIEMIKP